MVALLLPPLLSINFKVIWVALRKASTNCYVNPFLLWRCKPQRESLDKHDTCTIANCLLFPFFMKCIPLWLKCNPKLHTSQYSVPYRFKPTGSNCIHGSMNCFSSETHCHNFRLSAIDSLKTLQTHTTHYTHNIYAHTSSHSHAHIYNKHVMHL